MGIPQQINFTGKIEKDDGATMSFIAECLLTAQNYSKLFFRCVNCKRIL